MSGEKTTIKSEQSATATPEERQLNQLQLQRIQGNQADQQTLDKNLYGTINTILEGKQLPANLAGITGINEDQTKNMVDASLRDIYPQFQSAGILDSGVAAQIASRTAADVRNSNAQFNVTALSQLFNQALGGGSNLQANSNQQNQVLGNQLAGLRSINQNQSTIGMNPFLKSFETSLGKTLGSPKISAGPFSFGGS